MKLTLLLTTVIAPVLLAAGAPNFGARKASIYPANVQEASVLLENLRTDALQINDDATELRQSAVADSDGWEIQAAVLQNIKDRINDMGYKLNNLDAIQGAALPWQRQALRRAAPEVQSMAGSTVSAIDYIAQNPHYLFSPEYASLQSELSIQSKQLSDLLGKYQDWSKERAKDVQLSQVQRVSKND
jgi:hypothetical protein